MTVSELIAQLADQDPNAIVVIERDDEYWHVDDVDTALLVDPGVTNPVWDYHPDFMDEPNAVRICI